MITIDDKIASFKKIIYDDIKNRFATDNDNMEDETKTVIQKYKEQKERDIEKLKREYAVKLEQIKDKISSKLKKEGQDMLLSTNKEIYEDFFKSLNKKITEEYEGELGEKYLKNKLEQSKEDINSDDIICLFAKTLDRDKAIVNSVLGDIKVQASDNIKIGGFEIENKDRTYRNNYSLDLLIESQYKKILTQLKKELGIIA